MSYCPDIRTLRCLLGTSALLSPDRCVRTQDFQVLASMISVGELVEFEPGSPVLVTAIEINHDDDPSGPDACLASPHSRKLYGRSLVFDAVYPGFPEVGTFYVRRERSPVLDDPFGKSGRRSYVIR